jgi:hypothetical protein
MLMVSTCEAHTTFSIKLLPSFSLFLPAWVCGPSLTNLVQGPLQCSVA